MNRRRMSPAARYDEIISAAVRRSIDLGYNKISREDVALAAHCSPALVSQYLGTLTHMRRQIMRAAVTNEVLEVIAQGIVMGDKHAMRALESIRRMAIQNYMPEGKDA